jgi:hypothetical protein
VENVKKAYPIARQYFHRINFMCPNPHPDGTGSNDFLYFLKPLAAAKEAACAALVKGTRYLEVDDAVRYSIQDSTTALVKAGDLFSNLNRGSDLLKIATASLWKGAQGFPAAAAAASAITCSCILLSYLQHRPVELYSSVQPTKIFLNNIPVSPGLSGSSYKPLWLKSRY